VCSDCVQNISFIYSIDGKLCYQRIYPINHVCYLVLRKLFRLQYDV
jgi:hypothetical protein